MTQKYFDVNNTETARKKAFKGLYILNNPAYDILYGEPERKEISDSVDLCAQQMTAEDIRKNLSILKDVEVIFSGWGAPVFDDDFLDVASNLKAVFYASGSVKRLADRGQLFDRGIKLVSSVEANAIPVAEFCLSQILFSLKLGWHFALEIKANKAWMASEDRYTVPGCYQSTVGIISLGAISMKLLELLKPHDVNILVSSNHLTGEDARKRNVEIASIEEIFKRADVVSLHSPKHHEGIITGNHFRSMKTRATFLNTARGACVLEDEMIEALRERTDIIALLDVTASEPPETGSVLFDLPNIVMFPHISGSMHNECRRMARYAIDEYYRFCNGEPLKHEVTKEQWKYRAK